MPRRKRETYIDVFRKIKELAPGMAPTVILCDFERGLQKAAETVFPGARIVGCWVHYMRVSNNTSFYDLFDLL